VPIDDVDELPWILIELELELPVSIDDHLGRWEENTRGLILVGVVDINLSRRQVVLPGSGVVIMLTESDKAVRDEANLATRWSGNQANVTEVISNGAGDGNATDGFHLGKRIYQALILTLFEGIH